MEEEIFGSVYEKNSLIFEQGQAGGEMYIIQSGGVEISRRTGERDEVLAILGKGDFFGEMALINDEPRSATVRTIQRSRLLPITKQSLLERGGKDPSVFLHIIRALIIKLKNAGTASLGIEDMSMPDPRSADMGSLPEKKAEPAAAAQGALPDASLPDKQSVDWDPDSLVSFNPGDSIFRQGDQGDEMFIIIKGMVRICQGEGEDRQELFAWGPGEFFGEMAIISDAPRSATAVSDTESLLVRIRRAELHDLIRTRPEIALHITRTLISRLQAQQSVLEGPQEHLEVARRIWRPALKKKKIRVSLVSLSTCAGCSSVLLDDQLLEKLFKYTRIVYCPILMDRETIAEADVAIVEGLVRLRDDMEALDEARTKSRYLVAWGTCAVYGGIPSHANRFEPEELIAETYGQTVDAFAYYLSGKSGIDPEATYQEHEDVALLRQANRISAFERVDYAIPGCPPNPELLLSLIAEFIGEQPGRAKAVVCGECGRKPSKDGGGCLNISPMPGADPGVCLTSLGLACMGFVTRGGCGAPCTSNGLPCWGCRGPSTAVMKKITGGEYYEELFAKGLSQRCKVDEATARERVRTFRRQGHALYDFDHITTGNILRCR